MTEPWNPCQAEGCMRPRHARGLCTKHYQRVRNGTKSPAERFWSNTEPDGDCLVWTAYRNPGGYGQVWWDGALRLSHRVAWVLTNGDIPEGMTLDHTCVNPPCVKPEHIELITNEENVRRANARRDYGLMRRTVCPKGHLVAGDNAYRRPGRRESYACRECHRAYNLAYAARQRKLRKEGRS